MGLFRKKPEDDTGQAALAAELSILNGVLRQYPAGAQLNFGAPSRCPTCGNFGFVQHVNHAGGLCTTSCLGCHITWTITRRALRAHAAAAADRSVPAPTLGTAFHAKLAAEAARAPAPSAPPTAIQYAAVVPPPEPDTAPVPCPVVEPVASVPPTVPPTVASPVPPAPVIDLDRPVLRVLIVEDNPFDLATLGSLLDPFGPNEISVMHAATRGEGQELARASEFDVVMLDLDLPDSSGITTVLEWQHAVTTTVPLIATAAEAGAELIQQARALGVVHVVQKPHLDQLAAKGETGGRQLLQLLRTTATRPATPAPTHSA
jgi:CheY-like chemotaxis protein